MRKKSRYVIGYDNDYLNSHAVYGMYGYGSLGFVDSMTYKKAVQTAKRMLKKEIPKTVYRLVKVRKIT